MRHLRSDLVEILVNRLLKVERRRLDSVDVPLDLGESDHSFLDLPVRPNRLDAVGAPLFDDLVDG